MIWLAIDLFTDPEHDFHWEVATWIKISILLIGPLFRARALTTLTDVYRNLAYTLSGRLTMRLPHWPVIKFGTNLPSCGDSSSDDHPTISTSVIGRPSISASTFVVSQTGTIDNHSVEGPLPSCSPLHCRNSQPVVLLRMFGLLIAVLSLTSAILRATNRENDDHHPHDDASDQLFRSGTIMGITSTGIAMLALVSLGIQATTEVCQRMAVIACLDLRCYFIAHVCIGSSWVCDGSKLFIIATIFYSFRRCMVILEIASPPNRELNGVDQ
jgi:hypothetical protein